MSIPDRRYEPQDAGDTILSFLEQKFIADFFVKESDETEF
jgi:hypothetical protein